MFGGCNIGPLVSVVVMGPDACCDWKELEGDAVKERVMCYSSAPGENVRLEEIHETCVFVGLMLVDTYPRHKMIKVIVSFTRWEA